MGVEAVVLDGDEGLDEVIGYILKVHPDAVFDAVQGGQFLIHSRLCLAVDDARLRELVIGKGDVNVLREAGLDIESEDAGKQQRRRKYDEQHRDDYLRREADGAHDGADRGIRGLSGGL